MKSLEAAFGPNSALVEELYEQYQKSPNSVPTHWKRYFDELNGVEEDGKETNQNSAATKITSTASIRTVPSKEVTESSKPAPAGKLQKIKGVTTKIVENMDASLAVPTATSLRVLPVKMMIEDRTIINRHLIKRNEPKASFYSFHLLGCYSSN